jgi:hypothetical protein
MPTKRRRLANRQVGIPPAALEAWRVGDFHKLNRALGIRPWQPSPFDVTSREPPASAPVNTPFYDAWPHAWALREALLQHGPPGRVGRHGLPLGPVADGEIQGAGGSVSV